MKIYTEIKREFGSFGIYICSFFEDKPIRRALRSIPEIPARTRANAARGVDLEGR
jgi:3-methyladenine DNA glycosylase Tag